MATDHVRHRHSHHHHDQQQHHSSHPSSSSHPPPLMADASSPPPPPSLAFQNRFLHAQSQRQQGGRTGGPSQMDRKSGCQSSGGGYWPDDEGEDAPPNLMDLDITGSKPIAATAQLDPPPMLSPVPLPQPEETPPNTIPPEMEEATENWRQYAAAVLFHGRKLTGPSRRISRLAKDEEEEDEDWEMQEEEEGDRPAGEEDGAGAQFRGRRTTVTYRFPTNSSASAEEQNLQQQRRRAVARKLSMGHQRRSAEESRYAGGGTGASLNSEEFLLQQYTPQGRGNEQRRFSFQERSLLNANYAILRKSVDRFEVVGAFHRCHSEAYRHFLQSLTCYDLAPQHGLIVMLDAELTILKAVQVLCAHPAPRVAVISNTKDGYWSMFTVTDCLLALQKAHSEMDAQLGALSLRHFIEHVQNRRRLISVDDQSSVWDLARVFTLNRVHRVPVFNAETGELIAILCPRAICVELLKLLGSKCSLSPDLHSIPLNARLIGTWLNGTEHMQDNNNVIASVSTGDNCAKAVNIFLDRQVSALPVLSSKDGTLLGVLDKNNLLDRLFERLGAHQSPERCFQLMEETLVEELLPQARRRTLSSDCSVADAMRMLTEDGLMESLFVVEPSGTCQEAEEGIGDRLCGVLSHTDILAFILSCEQQQPPGLPASCSSMLNMDSS